MSLVGSRAKASFIDLNCDSVFIGAAGVSEEKGLTEYNLEDTEIKLAGNSFRPTCHSPGGRVQNGSGRLRKLDAAQ